MTNHPHDNYANKPALSNITSTFQRLAISLNWIIGLSIAISTQFSMYSRTMDFDGLPLSLEWSQEQNIGVCKLAETPRQPRMSYRHVAANKGLAGEGIAPLRKAFIVTAPVNLHEGLVKTELDWPSEDLQLKPIGCS